MLRIGEDAGAGGVQLNIRDRIKKGKKGIEGGDCLIYLLHLEEESVPREEIRVLEGGEVGDDGDGRGGNRNRNRTVVLEEG